MCRTSEICGTTRSRVTVQRHGYAILLAVCHHCLKTYGRPPTGALSTQKAAPPASSTITSTSHIAVGVTVTFWISRHFHRIIILFFLFNCYFFYYMMTVLTFTEIFCSTKQKLKPYFVCSSLRGLQMLLRTSDGLTNVFPPTLSICFLYLSSACP